MRALLVVNPKATATSSRVRDVLAHALASETRLDVVETKKRDHATELAEQAVGEGYDLVVALGGDGTVNEVVNGLLAGGPGPHVPALAVVPGGSTNVFARALGQAPTAVEATADLLTAIADGPRGRRRTIGLGTVDDRWFTFCAGLGLDAQVVRRAEHRRRDGRRATPRLFVQEALGEFFRGADRSEPALLLEREGSDPVPLGLALVCNTSPWTYLASRPVVPCPDASFDTGLDVFGLRTLGTVATLRHLAQILSTSPRPRGRAHYGLHDVDELVLRTATPGRPLPLQVDGDDLGDREKVRVRAHRGALDVVV